MQKQKYDFQFPHGLMFHRVHKKGFLSVGQGSISDNDFEKILKFVGIKNILSADEWLNRLIHNRLKKNDVCITFDDGLKCQKEVCLPILNKYRIKAFWFVYSSVFEGKPVKSEIYSYFATNYFNKIDDFFDIFFEHCGKKTIKMLDCQGFKKYVKQMNLLCPFYSLNDLKFRYIRNELLLKKQFEKIIDKIIETNGEKAIKMAEELWLSNSDLKNLSNNGHFIGLHSYSHPFQLAKLSFKRQLEEYQKNYNHLKNICQKKIVSMSHPLGSYNKTTLKILSQLKILCGFRSNMISPISKKINPSHLEIAREDSQNIIKKYFNKNNF